ncbi:MAG: hypothetical protein B6229_08855 [Spirochaetaceae bacterium 4572_7]|nr:MAG: hypothetical protein B6229_08855 [Spirochaetaceae bacterium 4572_7]
MRCFVLFATLFLSLTVFADTSIDELKNPEVWSVVSINNVDVYTQKDSGKVPVLCFHMLNDEYWYGITPKRFENFLIYLSENNFYPLSDSEFILKDFSRVPSGMTPIVLGSDDASQGNFLYKTIGPLEIGDIDTSTGKKELVEDSMVYLLQKYIKPVNGKINFTFYVSFNGLPFRQSDVKKISTLAYPHGCGVLKPEMRELIEGFDRYGASVIGGFDFDGLFSLPTFDNRVDSYDISRLGVDNRNIDRVYGFLESVPLFKTKRVFVVDSLDQLADYVLNESDEVLIK